MKGSGHQRQVRWEGREWHTEGHDQEQSIKTYVHEIDIVKPTHRILNLKAYFKKEIEVSSTG